MNQPTFPEPRGTKPPADLFADYLDFYRAGVEWKLRSIDEAALRTSRLPSGWTPIELLAHLVAMERRWFVWGFAGEPVAEPWGDNRDGDPDAPWQVPESVTLEELLAELHAGGRRTRELIAAAPLDQVAPPGPRFSGEPASLGWICFHVLQEYARHAGHLDIVVELAGGTQAE